MSEIKKECFVCGKLRSDCKLLQYHWRPVVVEWACVKCAGSGNLASDTPAITLAVDSLNILLQVANYYKIHHHALKSLNKKDDKAQEARSVSMYLCRELVPERSHRLVSKLHGGKSASASQYASRIIKKRLAGPSHVFLKECVQQIKDKCR